MKSKSRLLLLPLLPLAAFVTGTFFAPPAHHTTADQPPPGTTGDCGWIVPNILCVPYVSNCHCETPRCVARQLGFPVNGSNPNGPNLLQKRPVVNCGVRWSCTPTTPSGQCGTDVQCLEPPNVLPISFGGKEFFDTMVDCVPETDPQP